MGTTVKWWGEGSGGQLCLSLLLLQREELHAHVCEDMRIHNPSPVFRKPSGTYPDTEHSLGVAAHWAPGLRIALWVGPGKL